MLDIVIKNGAVLDGTGAAAERLDVGVKDGRIVALAASIDVEAAETIDASGRIVTPGFVDVHSHYDAQVIWDDLLEPSSPHGVTTVVLGNCGVGFAPARPADREGLIRLIEGVEDIPGAALAAGMAWSWESFTEYLDELATRRWAIDVGTQLAHGPLRTFAMGADSVTQRSATAAELDVMVAITREAASGGSFGFSTSRTLGHRALDGTPVPGTYATFEELVAIGKGMAAGGGGIMEVAPAGIARSDAPETVASEFAWIGALAEATGLPTTFLELQAHNDPDRWRREMDQAAAWRAAGLPVTPLVAGRSGGVLWGWDVRHPFLTRPSYVRLAHLPLAERLVALRRPDVRAAILAEADEPTTPFEHKQRAFMRAALPSCYLLTGVPDYEQPRERSLGALAEAEGRSLDEVIYDGMLAADDVMVLYPMYNYADTDHSVLYQQLQYPDAVVGTNDGGAHSAYTCDASIPTFLLSHWARDRHRGPRIELREIVRRLTSQPAALYGMNDRGRIEIGRRADLNVIDADLVRLQVPRAVHDLPGGATRLLQVPIGYDLTMVAGSVTRRNGRDTGARPGRLVTR